MKITTTRPRPLPPQIITLELSEQETKHLQAILYPTKEDTPDEQRKFEYELWKQIRALTGLAGGNGQ
jgi:hypothetical protein